MCAHFESVHDKALLKKHFGVTLPSELARRNVRPGYIKYACRDGELCHPSLLPAVSIVVLGHLFHSLMT